MINNNDRLIALLSAFLPELEKLTNADAQNVVIAGSNALKLHGLIIDWTPDDLDIVIFDPTPQQVLIVTQNYEQSMSYEQEKEVIGLPRSFKMEKKMPEKIVLSLNIILAYDISVPNELLYFKYWDKDWKVNSIKNIIEAKCSYMVGQGRKKGFLRAKDVEHLQKLKNLNFNYEIL